MRTAFVTGLSIGLALAFAPSPGLAAPSCTGAAFGKTCVTCDTGACFDSATRKIGACTPARCGEAAKPVAPKPFTPKPRDENTGY